MVERSQFAKATRDLLEDDLMLKLPIETLLFFRRQHRIVEVSRERFLSVLFSVFIYSFKIRPGLASRPGTWLIRV